MNIQTDPYYRKLLLDQYQFVNGSRAVLLAHCRKLTNSQFIKEHSSFAKGGSARNMLIHIATTYQFWIMSTAMAIEVDFANASDYADIGKITGLFSKIDQSVDRFISEIHDLEEKVAYSIKGSKGQASKLQLFTHVITHEFHHKGQIMTLCRQLGLEGVDTDIMR